MNYDYSYDRCVNYWKPSKLNHDFYTLGFPTTKTNITVASYDANLTPVPTAQAVKITRSGSTADISNDDAFRSVVLSDIQRRVLSFWYCSEDGASGTLTGKLRCTNGTAQDTVSVSINTDGKWHYAEMLFTPKAPLYTNVGDYVTPSITWETESGTGALIISGLSFGCETETVVNASQLGETLSAYNATYKTVTDAAAPMPSTTVREFTREANVGGWVYLNSAETATSTPQAGEIWEVSFAAKIVSGGVGNGFYFRFRECDESGNLTTTDASTAANIPLIDDNEWHTYTGYVTINSDAYENYGEIIPRFGWAQSNAAGTVRVNGVIIRKVGNQWNNSLPYFGFAQDNNAQTVLEEVDSTDSPIAYQKTIRAAHTGTQYTYTLNAPLDSFLQPTATDKWTLSFWAKTDGNNTVSLYKRTDNSTPQATTLIKDGEWHYYTIPLDLGSDFDLTDITLYYAIYPQTELYLNGVNLVPGTVALANESGQNSAALKNITIDTGSAKFNTAIEYDTDVNNTAYSRVKHYINNGKAYSYTYDQAGNISKITNPDGSWVSYEYDSLNQLTREYHSLPCVKGGAEGEAEAEGLSYDTIEYTYDTRGNILSKTYSLNGETVDTIAYTYNDTTWNDRLTSYNGTAVSYDTIGNPLSWHDGSTMTWQRGRQLASHSKNGVTSTYAYDDTGLRTSKTVGTVTTTYNVVDGTLRRMTDGTNTLQFIYGNGLSSVIYNGTEYWYVFNAQGDVIGLINANGEYVVEYTYDSWGKPLSKTGSLADTLGTLNPFRYRGYIYDEETGFYYCQTRYYTPEVCRFINSDSEALVIATPESASWDKNLYAYCDNNPIVRADDNGEFWHIVAGAVVGGVTSFVSTLITTGNVEDAFISMAFGAASGALIALCPAFSSLIGAGLAAAESITLDLKNQKENQYTVMDIAINATFSAGFGALTNMDVGYFSTKSFTDDLASVKKAKINIKKGNHPVVKKAANKTAKSIYRKWTKEGVGVGVNMGFDVADSYLQNQIKTHAQLRARVIIRSGL